MISRPYLFGIHGGQLLRTASLKITIHTPKGRKVSCLTEIETQALPCFRCLCLFSVYEMEYVIIFKFTVKVFTKLWKQIWCYWTIIKHGCITSFPISLSFSNCIYYKNNSIISILQILLHDNHDNVLISYSTSPVNPADCGCRTPLVTTFGVYHVYLIPRSPY